MINRCGASRPHNRGYLCFLDPGHDGFHVDAMTGMLWLDVHRIRIKTRLSEPVVDYGQVRASYKAARYVEMAADCVPTSTSAFSSGTIGR